MDDNNLNSILPKVKKEQVHPVGGMGFFETDTFENLAASGGQFIKQGAADLLSSTIELVKNVATAPAETSGSSFPSHGTLENFQTPSEETIRRVQQGKQTEHERMVFASLDEARQNAKKFAHEPSLDSIDVAVEMSSMPEAQLNKKLHLSLDYAREHTTNKPYYMAEFRKVLKGEAEKVEQIEITQDEQEVGAPSGPEFDKKKANELGPTSIYNAAG